jgi:hypothetical protein
MRFAIAFLVGILLLLLGHSSVHGQWETERFIPIGQSPGASVKMSRIGTVTAVDPRARSFVMEDADGRYTVSVPDRTRIWLDRSRQRQTNLTGTFEDLRVGRRVEVKYRDAEQKKQIHWIKIEAP